MKRFVVLIGNYGSGKTEIAINLAVSSAAKGLNTLQKISRCPTA